LHFFPLYAKLTREISENANYFYVDAHNLKRLMLNLGDYEIFSILIPRKVITFILEIQVCRFAIIA